MVVVSYLSSCVCREHMCQYSFMPLYNIHNTLYILELFIHRVHTLFHFKLSTVSLLYSFASSHDSSLHKRKGKKGNNIYYNYYCLMIVILKQYMCPTQGSSFFLGKVTALGVLCCFALFVCLTLLASFYGAPSVSKLIFPEAFRNVQAYLQIPREI